MKIRRLALTTLFVSLALHAARAADDDFARPGPYLGVGASRSVNVVEAFLDGTPVLQDIKVSDSWGVNGRVGYRVTSWFSVEAEYEWLDAFNASLGGAHLGTLDLQSATGNLRFIAPLRRFQPYLLLGAGALFAKTNTPFNALTVDHAAFAGRVGLGFDVYLTQNLLLNAGVEGVLSPAEVKITTGAGTFSEHGLGTVTFQFGVGYRF
ncbi:MAG TPA: porin family protein [Myxococcota bacterium]|nr:porin family protein [Myxococcota bacterium]